MDKIKTALIVVDLQNDYINGKLHLPYSSNIVNKVNKIEHRFDIVCFVKNIFHQKKEISKNITISDTGNYCIDGTKGAEFPNDLKINKNIFIRNYDDSFSALKSKNDKDDKLIDFLHDNEITHVFIGGVPGDYSIKYTAMESIGQFKTYIIIDLIKTIGKMSHFVNYIVSRKIPFVNTSDIDILLKGLSSKPGDYTNKPKKVKKNRDDYWSHPF